MSPETSDGWEARRFEDVLAIRRGHDLPKRERADGAVPVIGSSGPVGTHNARKIEGPTFTIGRSANIGKLFWVDGEAWPLNTTLYVTDFRGNNPKFLYYLLHTVDFTVYNSGTVQPMLNRNYVAGHILSVPPVDEQIAISEVLESLDDRIEWCHSGLRAAKGGLRALMQLASDRRPPVPLRDVAALQKVTVSSADLDGHVWAHYSIPAFDDGQRPIVASGADIKSGKYRVPTDSVLYSKLNPDINRVWLSVVDDSHPAVCSTELLPLVTYNDIPSGVLVGALTSRAFIDQMSERVSGGTKSHQRVTPDDVLAATIPDPAALRLHELSLVASLTEWHRGLQTEAQTLELTRDTLLPELVTGRLRLPDVDGFLERAGLP